MIPAFDYNTSDEVSAGSVLTAWSFKAHRACSTTVLPDGCQDFILSSSEYNEPDWFVSDLSHCAYVVPAQPDSQLYGLRLKPGTQLDTQSLARWLQNNDTERLFKTDQIDEFCSRPASLVEALDCLSSQVPDVQSAARDLGVSPRSLQRLTQSTTGLPPRFWWSLARVRKTARSLPNCLSLADAAASGGFADQAHMTREFRKWFGLTPKQLHGDQALLALLHETGYG